MHVVLGVFRVWVGVVNSGFVISSPCHNSPVEIATSGEFLRSQACAASANFDERGNFEASEGRSARVLLELFNVSYRIIPRSR